MNLDALIEILSDYRDEFGGDAEVRLMTQQQWPFENRIAGVTSGRETNKTSKMTPGSTSLKADRSATAVNGRGKRAGIVDPRSISSLR
jgi:hypothetical protein